jgi:hypothetical protein
LDTLRGRIASGAHIAASPLELKGLVDKQIRDYPKFVSNRLGALIDAAVPGYEGDTRVDWSPKSVETEPPANPSTQEIDASYGIKTPIKPPETVGDLQNAQELEKKGVKALPPYRPGSQDKVLKALEDFKGATPGTIIMRAGAVERQLDEAGDKRASLEVQQGQYEAIKKSGEAMGNVERALRIASHTDSQLDGRRYLEGEEARVVDHLPRGARNALVEKHEVPPGAVVDIAAAHGLTQLSSQDVLDIIKKVGLKPYKE